MEEVMFYYLYEVKNNLNGKIYVGVHKTRDLNDGYMGSGKIIRSAIAKHGIANFSKVILETFDNAKSMYAREKEVVTEEFLSRKDVYNIRRGGHGGFDYINKKSLHLIGINNRTVTSFKKMSEGGLLGANKTNAGGGGFSNPLVRQKSIKTKKERYNCQDWLNSEQAKIKRQLTFKNQKHSQGNRNSQFGTKWYTNGAKNIKLKNGESVPVGFSPGRSY
jgi:GIY-YIG catalytic domain